MRREEGKCLHGCQRKTNGDAADLPRSRTLINDEKEKKKKKDSVIYLVVFRYEITFTLLFIYDRGT